MIDLNGIWTDMIRPDSSVIEKIIRPVIVYFFLIVGLRLAGKRELAQLNPFDLVVLLTLSNTVQNAIIGNDNSVTGGIIGATTLLVVNYVVVRFLYKHKRLDRLVEGDAVVLMKSGDLRTDLLRKELITRDELEAAARRQGFDGLEDVDYAMLETGGTLSFVGKKPPVDVERHTELIGRLDDIAREIALLRSGSSR